MRRPEKQSSRLNAWIYKQETLFHCTVLHWLAAKTDNTYIKTAHHSKNCNFKCTKIACAFEVSLLHSQSPFKFSVVAGFFSFLSYDVDLSSGLHQCLSLCKKSGDLWLKNMKIIKIFSPDPDLLPNILDSKMGKSAPTINIRWRN